jgi:hypothetical protein
MELQMFIGQHLVDSIPLNLLQMNNPGYIHSIKNELEEKNEDIIDLSVEKPVFFIDSIPSRLNKVSFPGDN